MDRVHIDNDGMVFGIYFTPKDADQPMPPWASELPTLGAVDTGQVAPDDLGPRHRSRAGRDDRAGSTTAGSAPVDDRASRHHAGRPPRARHHRPRSG